MDTENVIPVQQSMMRSKKPISTFNVINAFIARGLEWGSFYYYYYYYYYSA